MKYVAQPTHSTPRPDDIGETTLGGVRPTITVGETYAPSPVSPISDTFALFKPRVTSLVVLAAWAGYFMAGRKLHVAQLDWHLASDLLGVALVSSAAATLNQVWEHDSDARMLRTRNRPLPAKRMSAAPASLIG